VLWSGLSVQNKTSPRKRRTKRRELKNTSDNSWIFFHMSFYIKYFSPISSISYNKVALFYFQMSNFFRPIHWICRGFQKRHKNVSTVKLKGLYAFSQEFFISCISFHSAFPFDVCVTIAKQSVY